MKRRIARAALTGTTAFAALARLVPAARAETAVVLSTDFEVGYYSLLGLEPPWPRQTNVAASCADASVRHSGGSVYVVGRYGCDHVQVLDPSAGYATIAQWSTGNGTNPQDIEVYATDKAYVSLYDRAHLLVVDPRNGQTRGTIDLSAFADSDGFPESAEMALVGTRLFVALQRLDRQQGYAAVNPSFVAVVDCTTDQLVDADAAQPGVQAIVLTGRNPFTELVFDPVRRDLYVGEAGRFGILDGGVERIDPLTLQPLGFAVTEAVLGGDLNAVRLWVDGTGFAVVNDASYRTRLVRFDTSTGTALGTLWQSTGFDLCDVEIDARDQVLLADRDLLVPGVRIFRARDGVQITTSPLGFGLPPCDIGVPRATLSSTPVPARTALHLAPNWPDPFRPETRLRIEAPPGETATLEIVDVRGHCVRRLWHGGAAGRRDLVWDGRDASGARLPSGVYWARLRCGADTRTERLTLVR